MAELERPGNNTPVSQALFDVKREVSLDQEQEEVFDRFTEVVVDMEERINELESAAGIS